MNNKNKPLEDRDQPTCLQADWSDFFAALEGVEIPDDFLSAEERGLGPHDHDPFHWLTPSSDLPDMMIEDWAN
ncbi:hypothetical protein [Azospirillum sp. B4]|uniref:hypothetical protein n=1 Tax=Azospirillum sp. B4 TaxID=95605 RepID=UPI0011DDAD87|nr:hypothetical protein [Azospirillum sp. B4]